jgi:hypothetical protein
MADRQLVDHNRKERDQREGGHCERQRSGRQDESDRVNPQEGPLLRIVVDDIESRDERRHRGPGAPQGDGKRTAHPGAKPES